MPLTPRILPQLDRSRQVFYAAPILTAATSTASATYRRSYIPPESASAADLDKQVERLHALVVASRLDTLITNADTRRVVTSFAKAAAFDHSASFRRFTPWNAEIRIAAAKVTRRWSTAAGRQNIAKTWSRRIRVLEATAKDTSETVKLITLTFRGVEESWRGFGEIRRFINTLSHWAKRQGYATRYIWTAELQKRCALHYHIIVTGCPFVPTKLLAQWWRFGYSDVRAASAEKAAKYALKYVTKGTVGVGSGQALSALLFSARAKRHFGSSRAVSAQSVSEPVWLTDLKDLLSLTVEELEVFDVEGSESIWIQFANGETLCLSRRLVEWRLIHRSETG